MNRILFYKLTIILVLCSPIALTATGFIAEPHAFPMRKPLKDYGLATVHATSTANRHKSIDPRRLETAIQRSANYLSNACEADGKFIYRVNLNPRVRVPPRYNILRHAGTIYSLAMAFNHHPDEITKAAMIRAGRFLKHQTIRPLPGRRDLLAVWTNPHLSLRSEPVQAKLGGTGLGLVALLSIEKIKPGETSIADLRKLGNFLRYMQKSDGSFYSKYIPDEGGRSKRWKSLYYPGEAALGLLMLYEHDPSVVWLDAAADAVAHLARMRANQTEVEADHWALLATAKLLPIYERSKQPLPVEDIRKHAVQICRSILKKADQLATNASTYGCFTGDGRTTPTATRLEGLLAALSFLSPEYEDLRHRMTANVKKGIFFLLGAQVAKGEYAGAIPRAVHPLPQNHPGFTQSFNRRVTEVRIDYVQHALSAMIQYQRIFIGHAGK